MPRKRTTPKRDPNKEYPPYRPIPTPVTFGGRDFEADRLKQMLENQKILEVEAGHVESFEEANDFGPEDDEDLDFGNGYTMYEMHEMALEAEAQVPPEAAQQVMDESNETVDQGASNPTPDAQPSAPDEPTQPSPS